MTVSIVVAGVKGAGVSTVGLVLAAVNAAGAPTLLVEADPSGGSLLGWCEGLRAAGDLYDVTSSRHNDGFTAVAQRLGDMWVVPGRGTSFRVEQALSRPRVPWRSLFDTFDGLVVIDVGRLYPGSPTLGLLAAADVVVLVAPSEPGPVAATMEWANRAGRHGAADPGVMVERLRMVTVEVVGRRRRVSVSPRDLSLVTGAGYLGHLPHDPVAVELLCRGASVEHKSLRRRRLIEAARVLPGLLSNRSGVGVT